LTISNFSPIQKGLYLFKKFITEIPSSLAKFTGTAKWDETIPITGKRAEQGCIGCAWYDINKWRTEIIKKLK